MSTSSNQHKTDVNMRWEGMKDIGDGGRQIVWKSCVWKCCVWQCCMWKSRVWKVACVWNISIDAKLVPWFFLVAGGCRECHSSAANEDGYDILWCLSGTLDRRTCFNFHVKFLWWAVANPKTTSPFFQKTFHGGSSSFFILAQLAQSETAVNFMFNLFSDIWNQPSHGLWQLTLAMATGTPTTNTKVHQPCRRCWLNHHRKDLFGGFFPRELPNFCWYIVVFIPTFFSSFTLPPKLGLKIGYPIPSPHSIQWWIRTQHQNGLCFGVCACS